MNRLLAALFCVMLVPVASGQVLITEIMYNPNSPEGRFPKKDDPDDKGEPTRTEWVEIHNMGAEPVDVSGWHLADEDGQTTGLPKGTTLKPGETVVLIPADCTVEEFREAWGEGFAIYPVGQWGRGGLDNLSNSPSETNETLELRNAKGEMVDQVNYDDENGWPSDQPDGPSIYLLPQGFDTAANDLPVNWARSEVGVHHARQNNPTKHFKGKDIGSPGQVPEPLLEPAPLPLPAE